MCARPFAQNAKGTGHPAVCLELRLRGEGPATRQLIYKTREPAVLGGMFHFVTILSACQDSLSHLSRLRILIRSPKGFVSLQGFILRTLKNGHGYRLYYCGNGVRDSFG